MATVRNGLVRIARAWRALDVEQRRAAVAAVALLLTMFLPWYEKNVVVGKDLASDSVSAFGDVSFIEAAIFLVALGVLLLLFFRAEQRAFHLPGGDGTMIFGAGAWAAFLLFWRVFDRPDVHGSGATVGIQWGFFLAFVAAGMLTYVGFRLRTSHRVAEPTRAQDPTTRVEPAPPPRREITYSNQRRRRRPAGPDAPTQIAGQLSFEEGHEDPPTEQRR
ncbi:MAG: hypothetical protein JWM73_2671 [Solirubrobacterales bacterium]|nr:hypothetical protein [Solirubrobacterales bacterium]